MNHVDEMIQGDWANEPDIGNICARVWTSLSKREEHLDHYTFYDLQEMAGWVAPELLTKVLMYLSNPRLCVLSTCLMYEDDGYFFELPAEELAHYARGEPLIHPRFGERLSEAEVLVCFSPGAALNPGEAR